jgi:hypothetical protein
VLAATKYINKSAIEKHLRGKNAASQPGGHWASDLMVRAMAAQLDVRIVCIDSLTLDDTVSVFAPGTSRQTLQRLSWRDVVAPAIVTQRACAGGTAEKPIRVIVYNGVNHFDATRMLG